MISDWYVQRYRLIGIALLVLIASGGLLVAVVPLGLWSYSLARATSEIQHGLQWPSPRRSDSLPTATNSAMLDQALIDLAAAQRWRPDNAYAYRLAGHVYLARAAWPEAIAALDQARIRSPNEPLIAWESSLAYEQMQLAIEQARAVPIAALLAGGQLNAPGELVRSQFCSAAGAASCYFGHITYSQTDAIAPDGTLITRDALFLHPPASLAIGLRIPADTPGFGFVIGLDPAMHEGRSDGASFEVFVRDDTGEYSAGELAVDATTARHGWIHGWADLSRWKDQQVILRIASNPGAAGDNRDDWYGWADLALTTPDAARYAVFEPHIHLPILWQAARQTSATFTLQRDQAAIANHPTEARIWQRRIDWLQR